MSKRLYRSRRDKMLAGVCGGLANYFKIDPVIMRVLFVVLTIGPGLGFLTYILLWIIVPQEPIVVELNEETQKVKGEEEKPFEKVEVNDNTKNEDVNNKNNLTVIFAVILILIGTFWLMDNFIPFFSFDIWFPFVLITIGLIILLTNKNDSNE